VLPQSGEGGNKSPRLAPTVALSGRGFSLLNLTVLRSKYWRENAVIARKGGRVMSSKEFREFADECIHWAKTARRDREKLGSALQ
jgi:hypothetical protein